MTESNDRIAELERAILRRRSGLGAYLEVIDDTRALIAADEAELSRLRAEQEQQGWREVESKLGGFRLFALDGDPHRGTHLSNSLVAHIKAEATGRFRDELEFQIDRANRANERIATLEKQLEEAAAMREGLLRHALVVQAARLTDVDRASLLCGCVLTETATRFPSDEIAPPAASPQEGGEA
jgi:hypothetical protein